MEKYLAQGARVRFLRSLSGLIARDFCERYGLSLSSFSKWEAGFSRLSVTSASRLVAVAKEIGIICPISWLLHGKGEEPRPITENTTKEYTAPSPHTLESEFLIVSREIELLRTIHHSIEVLSVTDESMTPQFNIGDYVGGHPIDLADIRKYLDSPCIIETEDKKKRLRRIGYNNKKFFLFGTNTSFKGGPLFELSPDFLKVSPVFWHRMHETANEQTEHNPDSLEHDEAEILI